MFEEHYKNWRFSRMNGLKKYISPDYFKNKKILELGCGYAHIGNMFYELGAIVTSSDGRKEHLKVVNNKYPNLNTLLLDCDKDKIIDNYDIIIHWGLLYHLSNIEFHLENVSQKCNILLLETEVSDSDNIDFYIKTRENGYDQALNTYGIRPSQYYVENILQKNGFNYKLIKDPILNSGYHIYDWNISNSNKWKCGLRRFWICWKNIDSPLIKS